MIRLLGFLVGSAVSIGIFLLILGIPDINLSTQLIGDEQQLIDDDQIETVSQVAQDLKADLQGIAIDIVDEVTEQIAQLDTEPESNPDTQVVVQLPETESPGPEFTLITPDEPQIAELAPQSASTAELIEPTPNDPKWHAFWNPFRSRLAAEGFVGQLEKVTGLDYRVVKIKTGVYEVTFAYESDDERRNKMSLIASATGLDLPDS